MLTPKIGFVPCVHPYYDLPAVVEHRNQAIGMLEKAGCEVDLTALITTYLLAQFSETPAFNFDITGYLEEDGAIQFAHCGAAEPSLAGDPRRALLRSRMRTNTGAAGQASSPRSAISPVWSSGRLQDLRRLDILRSCRLSSGIPSGRLRAEPGWGPDATEIKTHARRPQCRLDS